MEYRINDKMLNASVFQVKNKIVAAKDKIK